MALHKLKEFHVPVSVDAALALLGRDETLVLAGGTFLHGLEARGLLGDVEELVDIRRTGLGTMCSEASGLELGATLTFAQLAGADEVRQENWLGALADALAYPPAQIRNTATIGGCVAAACPFFDIPTALLALDGSVTARGRSGARSIPLTDFFAGMFANSLQPDEIVAAVTLPRPTGKTASAFIKLEGNANDLAIVNAAAWLSIDAEGVCCEARVALGGGVAETAVRAPAVEVLLAGSRIDAIRLQEAAEAVIENISPMADHRASAEYRTAMAKVMTRRTLERVVARLT